MPSPTVQAIGDGGLPRLPVPDLYLSGEEDGRTTYRDGGFDPEDNWTAFLMEDETYTYVETYRNEFLRERAPARDVRYTKREVLHSTRRTRPIGGGRCVTEVDVRYRTYKREAYFVAIRREIWRTNKRLSAYFEALTGDEAALAGLAGDAFATGVTTSAGAATGAGAAAPAAGVAVPVVLAAAVGTSAFLTATAFMKWVKEDETLELHETGWTRLGWYLSVEEPVDPHDPGRVQPEAVGYHPCERPITGSPAPPNPALRPGEVFPVEPEAPAAEPGPLPGDEDEIEFDPTDPHSDPFLDEVDRSPLVPGPNDGEYTDSRRDPEGDFTRILRQVDGSWLVAVFDNRYRLVRDDLYDREADRFVDGHAERDRAVGDGMCRVETLGIHQRWVAWGLRVEMHYRLLLVEQSVLLELTGLTESDLLTLTSLAAGEAGFLGSALSAPSAAPLADVPSVGALKAAGEAAPYVSMLVNILSLTDREEVELVDEGWAPVGFTTEPERFVGESEYWRPTGVVRPCDPRIAWGYVPDHLPPEFNLPPLEVPEQVAAPPVDTADPVVIEPIEDESAPPWEGAEAPDDAGEEEEFVSAFSDRPRRPRRTFHRQPGRHYAIDGEEPPADARHLQWAIEHSYSLLLGQDLHGASVMISWSDLLGEGRESRSISIRFRLNEALMPQRPHEFTPFPLTAYLLVSVSLEDAFLDRDGNTRRTYNATAHILDVGNGRFVSTKSEDVNDSPVTAARSAIQQVLEEPLRQPLVASEDRPWAELPYAVRPAHEAPIVEVPPGWLPKRFHALYYAHYGVKWLVGFILLLAVGIPILTLVRNGPDSREGAAQATPVPTATPTTVAEARPTETSNASPTPLPEPPAEVVEMVEGADLVPLAFVPLSDGNWLAWTLDPDGGISWSIFNSNGELLDPSQLVASWVIHVLLTQPWLDAAFNNSSFPCGAVTEEFRVTCPLGAGPLEEGEYFIIGAQLEGRVADSVAAFTYGLAFDDDGDDGDNYQFSPPFDSDFFRNTEHWYRLHIAADGTRSMWADGIRDGVPGVPMASSAAVIEWGDTVIWLIPRSEVPGDSPAYRVTAFHNRGEPGAVPIPDNSGGDVSGETVTEPLLPIDVEVAELSDPSSLPPDIPDPLPRLPIELPPDEHVTAALVADFMDRATAATASGDPEQVIRLVLPELLAGETGDACRADMEASIVLADSLTLVEVPPGPDLTQGFAFYVVETTIDYPTGSVPYPALLAASNVDGRLYLLLPSCLG